MFNFFLSIARVILPLSTRRALGPSLARYFPSIYSRLVSISLVDSDLSLQAFADEKEIEWHDRYRLRLQQEKHDSVHCNIADCDTDFLVLVDLTRFRNSTLRSLVDSIEKTKGKPPVVWGVGSSEVESPKSVCHKTTNKRDLNAELLKESFDYLVVVQEEGFFATQAFEKISQQLSQSRYRLFYSDHDSVTEDRTRCNPIYKPDWNIDYLLDCNYIGGVVGFSRSFLLNQKRPLDLIKLWENLHATLIRATALCDANHVCHVADILFHRNDEAKPSVDADTVELRRALEEVAPTESEINFHPDGVNRIHWALPDPPPSVSIIIPARNEQSLTRRCIDSVCRKTHYSNFEVMLVDNGSDQTDMLAYLQALKKEGRVRVIHDPRPFNYSRLNNDASRVCKSDILLFMNNDVEVLNTEWLTEMISHTIRPDIGCVGAKLYFPDGRIQHAGVIVGYGGVAGHAHKFFHGEHPGYMNRLRTVQNFSAVTAACMAVQRDIFEEAGGFDETNLAVAFNDVDFCLRVQALGYRNLWTPYAELYHHESVTRGEDLTGESKQRFENEIEYMKRRWSTHIRHDPAYNPNLAIDREDFAVRVRQAH